MAMLTFSNFAYIAYSIYCLQVSLLPNSVQSYSAIAILLFWKIHVYLPLSKTSATQGWFNNSSFLGIRRALIYLTEWEGFHKQFVPRAQRKISMNHHNRQLTIITYIRLSPQSQIPHRVKINEQPNSLSTLVFYSDSSNFWVLLSHPI